MPLQKQTNISVIKRTQERFRAILEKNDYFLQMDSLHRYFDYNTEVSSFDIAAAWEKYMLNEHSKEKSCSIDCYLHIPFCKSRCTYCRFFSWPGCSAQTINTYLEWIAQQMRFFSPVFRKIKLQNLYVGGGSPNILTLDQIKKLGSNLFRYFEFTDRNLKTYECNPSFITRQQLVLLRSLGFNRISMGIQSLNKRVLKAHGRAYQKFETIKNAIAWAKKAGFENISIDLILGLPYDSLEEFQKSFTRVAQLKPANIVIYSLSPQNENYLKKYFNFDKKTYYKKYLAGLIPQALKIMKSLEDKCGYNSSDGLNPAKLCWGFKRNDYVEKLESRGSGESKNESTFGLGIQSMSYIHNALRYRQHKITHVFDPEEKIYKARALNKKECMIRFVINQLNAHSRISINDFRQFFKTSIFKAFPTAINSLQKIGQLNISKDFIWLNSNNPKDKYIAALFFIDPR